LHVVGEVVNGRPDAIQYVQITADLYSAAGTLLATDDSFSEMTVMAAGSDSPFDVLFISPPPGVSRVVVRVTDYTEPAYDPPAAGLVATITNSYTDVIGALHVVGTVTNSSSTTYDYVEPIVGFYDASGRLLREDFTFTSPSTLGPGQSGTFDSFIFDAKGLDITQFRTWVDGSR
jgi:hypothetical protein